MKNFFKKLSFVLAIAMVLTTIAPATASAAEVVPAKKVNLKVNGEKTDAISLEVGETETVKVGLPVKKAYAGQKSTFKTGFSVEGTAVEVVRVGNRTYEVTAVEAGEATITIGAAKTKALAEAGEFKKFDTLKVTVEAPKAELTATQTAANQITVTGTDLTANAADYALKLGTAKKTLASAEKMEDGSVVLTTAASSIADGVYTLVFGETSVEVACETAKASNIVVFPDVAVMTSTHSAIVFFQVQDQFGNDVTKKSNLTVNGTDYDAAKSNLSKGYIVFDCGTSKQYNLNLSQIALTIAEHEGGAFYSNVLTVGEEARLHEATIKGVYKVVGNIATEAKLGEGAKDLRNHFLLVSGVDQYGIPYSAKKMNQDVLSLVFSSVTGLTVNVAAKNTVVDTVEVDGVEYAKIALGVDDSSAYENGLKSGEVSVIGYVLTSGSRINDTITVGSGTKIASLKVTANGPIYGNNTATLEYEALDVDGNSITDIDTLCKFNDTDFFKESGLSFVGSANGIAKLKVKAKSTDTQTIQTISWMSDTNEYGYTSLTVLPDPYPVAVVGVWTAADDSSYPVYLATTDATSTAINVTLEDLKYEDQYGNIISRGNYGKVVSPSGIKVKISEFGKKTDSFATLATGVAVGTDVVANGANKGTVLVSYSASATSASISSTAKITVESTLPQVTGDKKSEYTFTVAVVNANDCAADVYYYNNNFYTANAPANTTPFVDLYYGSTLVRAAAGVANDYVTAFATGAQLNPTLVGANATGAGESVVVMNDKVGTTINTAFTTGNADAKIVYSTIYNWVNGWEFSLNGYATVTNAAVNCASYLSTSSQYWNKGTDDQSTPRITISNLPKDETAYTLNNNGTAGATITFNKHGFYTLKVTFAWNDGYVYEDIMCFNVTTDK